jgi:hypothetical protein
MSPRCPRTAINSQRLPPAAPCGNEASLPLNPRATHENTLVNAQSLGDDEDQGGEMSNAVRDRRRRARCVPDPSVNAGNLRSLAGTSACLMTCAHTGPSIAAYVLLSSRSRVRVAVGAQLRKRTPAPFPPLGSQPESQPTELRACGGPGTSHLAIARYITARQIPDPASGRRAALVPNANRGPCRVGNLFAIE